MRAGVCAELCGQGSGIYARLKESYVKAHGTGIPLGSFCTIGGLPGTMRTLERGDYFCSVYIPDEPSAELEIKIL